LESSSQRGDEKMENTRNIENIQENTQDQVIEIEFSTMYYAPGVTHYRQG